MKKNGMISLMAILLLVAILMTGCAAAATEYRPAAAPAETAAPTAKATEPAAPAQTQPLVPAAKLTAEEAEAIALEHAGFTADQVSWLRTEYEIDDGIPQYEVSFHEGRWEYDYEINAETGAILSYDRDD